jgi:hypothetical protein
METKKFIGVYMAEISNEQLLLAVKNIMHWRETGLYLCERTVVDDIYEIYTKPIGGYGIQSKFDAQDIIYREVAERVIDGRIKC